MQPILLPSCRTAERTEGFVLWEHEGRGAPLSTAGWALVKSPSIPRNHRLSSALLTTRSSKIYVLPVPTLLRLQGTHQVRHTYTHFST